MTFCSSFFVGYGLIAKWMETQIYQLELAEEMFDIKSHRMENQKLKKVLWTVAVGKSKFSKNRRNPIQAQILDPKISFDLYIKFHSAAVLMMLHVSMF